MAFSSADRLVTTSELFACKHEATQRHSSILGLAKTSSGSLFHWCD